MCVECRSVEVGRTLWLYVEKMGHPWIRELYWHWRSDAHVHPSGEGAVFILDAWTWSWGCAVITHIYSDWMRNPRTQREISLFVSWAPKRVKCWYRYAVTPHCREMSFGLSLKVKEDFCARERTTGSDNFSLITGIIAPNWNMTILQQSFEIWLYNIILY